MPDVSTVGDLIDYLATQPRDRKVVMSKDAEGNGFSPLADASEGMYAADSTWSGETPPAACSRRCPMRGRGRCRAS